MTVTGVTGGSATVAGLAGGSATAAGPGTPSAIPPGGDAPAVANRWAVFGVIAAGSFMTSLDGSIVNIGLPAIGRSFGAVAGGGVEWVVIAYLLAIAATLLTFGRLSDMIGRKPVWAAGIALFTLASAACGAAPSLGWLIATRALQGVGGALIFAPAVALVTDAFPASGRGQALGLTAVVTSLGVTVGPTLGGLITEYLSWRWIFYVNVPVGILTFLATLRVLRTPPRASGPQAGPQAARPRIDVVGALLIAVGLTGTTLALSFGSTWGWTSARVLASAAVGILALVATVLVERRVADPVLDLALFRNAPFALSLASVVFSFLALAAVSFLLPFYFEQLRGYTAVHSGLMFTPMSITVALVAPLSGTLADRLGSRWLAAGGLAVAALGLVLLATGLDAGTTTVGVAWRLVVMGIGMGLFQSPNTTALMAAAPAAERGAASGLQATGRVVGQSVSIALAGAIFAGLGGAAAGAVLAAHRAAHGAALGAAALVATEGTFVHAIRTALLVSAGFAALGSATASRVRLPRADAGPARGNPGADA